MMSVFTIKWHLIFRSLAKESARFQNTEYLCKIIARLAQNLIYGAAYCHDVAKLLIVINTFNLLPKFFSVIF